MGDRETFIGPSPLGAGAYDLTQIVPPSAPVLRGDELWFYYTGIKYRASWSYVGEYPNGEHVPFPGLDPDTGAICLAVLRRDGFVSLDAGDVPGTLLTEPFSPAGGRLYLNADALNGEILAEVLDPGGEVLDSSEPLKGDHLRAEMKWKSDALVGLDGKAIRLCFSLRNAHLYSYWLD